MLQGISHLIRLAIEKVILGYGADNLMRYLKLHIREDFLKRLKLGDLLRKNAEMASNSVKRDIGVDDVIEDLVDMFIDDDMGPKALGLLVGHARERGISPEDSRVMVHGGSMGPELVKEMEGLQGEFGKILYDFLNKSVKNRALKWVAEKGGEESEESLVERGEKETEEGESEGEPEHVGIGVKDERELEEEMVEKNKKMEGLIEGANDMLDREIGDDRKRVVYKAILNDRIIDGKNLDILVKETGLAIGTLHKYEQDLRVRLEGYFRGRGLGPKFDLGKKEVVVPDYRVLLKDNKELQVELKGWLKDEGHEEGVGRGKEFSEMTRKILNLLSEGRVPSEIDVNLGLGKGMAQNTKTRYFNKGYEGWYMDKVEQVRKASYRKVVRAAAVRIKAVPDYMEVLRKDRAAQDSLKAWLKEHKGDASELLRKVLMEFAEGKGVEDVAEDIGVDGGTAGKMKSKHFDGLYVKWYREGRGEGEEEELKGPGRVHERMVEYVFKPNHQRVTVTVEFKSRFDSTGEMGTRGREDPSTGETRPGEMVDPEFEWKEYRAVIRERSGKHTLHYTFVQPVEGKTGKLTGTPKERLEVDGKLVEQGHALMKLIHKNMEEYVLPKADSVRGITPMQHAFSVHYVNTYHGDREVDWQDYHGVEDFVMKHHGLFPKDPQHERFERERREFQQRKVLGPYEVEGELTALITQYERDLKKETDPGAKKKIRDSIDELKKMIKEKSDVDQKMIDDLIKQEMMIRHPTTVIPEHKEITTEKPEKEPVTAFELKYALIIPPVGGGGAKDFLNIAKRYGGRNLDRWFDPAQVVQLAGLVNREINRLKVLHIKDPDRVKKFDTDKERFQELLPEFIHDLRVRRDNHAKQNPADYANLERNRNVKWVEDSGAIDKVLEDVKKEITGGPATAVVIDGPKSENARKLVSLFHAYGLTHQPNPRDWLEPDDFRVLIKSFNGAVATKLNKEMDAKKPKGMSEDEWKSNMNRIRASYEQDLKSVEELLPKFIEDLKLRRDEFAKEHPLDYKALAGRKNVLWVDDGAKVKKTLETALQELREPLKPAEKKQPSVKIIEIGKFEALGGFLRSQLKGFLTLGGRFKRLGLNPIWTGEGTAGLKADQVKLKDVYEDHVKKIETDKTLSEEEKKALDQSRAQMRKVLEKIGQVIETRESRPAISGAKILQHYLAYFSSLFTIFSSLLWYRNKYSSESDINVENIFYNYLVVGAGAAGDVPADPEEKKDTGLTKDEAMAEAGQLQEEIFNETNHLSGLNIKPREAVKEGLSSLRISLKRFLEMMDVVTAKTAAEPAEPEPAEPPKKPSETPAYEEAYKRHVIPEDLLYHSRRIVEKMKEHANSKVKAMAPKAEKELKDLTENLVKTFKEGFTDEDIERMAEQKKISPEKAAVQLRRHQDALTKAAMDEFVIAWSDILSRAEEKIPLTKKERSPLGNKPPSEYDRMGQFVEDHLPELFQIASPDKGPELPEPGIPTPKRLREEIERIWSTEKELTHEDLIKEYRATLEEHMGGGGGGGKRKTRQKAVKTPPPSGTWQQIMHNIATRVKDLMVKSPEAAKEGMERLVIEVLMRQVLAVKKALAGLKADEHIEIDDVIDGLVYLVKQIFNHMLLLKVAPSVSQMRLPPPGAPDFSGTPDIPVENLKDTIRFFNTFKGVTDVINEYLKPHEINIPKLQYVHPEKGTRRQEKYWPGGLAETMQFYEMKEKGGPQRPSETEYKPLEHIPGEAEKKLREQKPGAPSFTGKPHEEYGEYKKSELLDYPTQMSADIAAKFIGVELPKEEFEAVMS